MAKKEINFVIKVNNKEVDLTKTSFKQFDDIIKQAKKDLLALPLSDPRYKVLVSDIKTAEASWKAAQKSASELGDEMDKGEQTTKSYTAQIKELVKANIALKDSGQGSSQAYADNEAKIKSLRDEQEAMTRSTQKLDDALSNIPGPIGQIGQGMQQLESISQSAKSAFNSLGLGFKTFDQTIKTSGVGALVLLLVTLVAAVVDAAKKSEPLQKAFAVMGDAVGALFDALKPLTDFIVNVFVGAIELASAALNGLASLFGGVNKGFKQQSIALEKELKFQKTVLDNFNSALSANLTERLKIEQDFNTKLKEIYDGEYKDEAERQRDILLLILNTANQKSNLSLKERQDRKKNLLEIKKIEGQALIDGTDNQRTAAKIQEYITKKSNLIELALLQQQNKIKLNEIKQGQQMIEKSNVADKDKLLQLLQESYSEELQLSIYYRDLEQTQRDANKASRLKREREFSREDIALINKRSNETLQLTTELIKEDNARTLQGAKDKLETLKESQRLEIESTNLTGATLKGLKQKQAAETKAANEEIRKAQIQYDSYLIDLEINKQNRLVTEAGIGTQQYFDARKEIITKSFEKEVLLADGNADKIETARTKQWKDLLELDKEGIQSQIDMLNIEYSTLYEGTVAFYQKQRDIENENYKLAELNAQGNYDKLEALRKQHEKNMEMIDLSELYAKIDIEQRKADTVQQIFGGYFKAQREVEEMRYAARLKAAGDNVDAIDAIEKEHQKNMRESRLAELQLMLDFGTKLADVASSVYTAITAVNDARMAKELKNAKGNEEEQEKIKKKYFEKNKKIQIAQAYIATFQSAVQAFSAMAGIPVVGPALGAIAAAAAIVAGLSNVAKIKSTEYEGGGSSGSSSAGGGSKPPIPNYGKNYGDGGMIEGPRHSSSEGGVPIMAEGGEAVMSRGAVTMFRPLLSMINQAGGGTSFTKGAIGQANFDNPKSSVSNQTSPQIIKSYVVSSELTTEQYKQARLKDLSTL